MTQSDNKKINIGYHIGQNFKIGVECKETYPCQHDVLINGEVLNMNGLAIYEILHENNITIPEHFKFYEDMFIGHQEDKLDQQLQDDFNLINTHNDNRINMDNNLSKTNKKIKRISKQEDKIDKQNKTRKERIKHKIYRIIFIIICLILLSLHYFGYF